MIISSLKVARQLAFGIVSLFLVSLLIGCDASSSNIKSSQELTADEKRMVKGLLHEALKRTFSDYEMGKVYQHAIIYRNPRDPEKELKPPIEGLAIIIGMFSPKYEEEEIEEKIKKKLVRSAQVTNKKT